jgi:hypothetical protein
MAASKSPPPYPGPAIRTGEIRGAFVGGDSPVRACRRRYRAQQFGYLRPPAPAFSPTTGVFSSDDHRRRRSVPPTTSARISRVVDHSVRRLFDDLGRNAAPRAAASRSGTCVAVPPCVALLRWSNPRIAQSIPTQMRRASRQPAGKSIGGRPVIVIFGIGSPKISIVC